MPSEPKRRYYAVVRGREPGIYRDREQAIAQVQGFTGGFFRGFASEREARAFLKLKLRKERTPPAPEVHPRTYLAYTDGSLKTESASASAVILQGKKVVAQGHIALPPTKDVGEVEGRAMLLALTLTPTRSRLRIHTDREDFAYQWKCGQGDRWRILEALRSTSELFGIQVEIHKVPRKEVETAHQKASQAHQIRSRQHALGENLVRVLEEIPERYRKAVIQLVEVFLRTGQEDSQFVNWLERGDSPTRKLLLEWCSSNPVASLLEAVRELDPAAREALKDHDREAAWAQMPPTEKQLAYLRALGYVGNPPQSLLEASRLIEDYKERNPATLRAAPDAEPSLG